MIKPLSIENRRLIRYRHFKSKIFKVVCLITVLGALLSLFGILGGVFYKSIPVWTKTEFKVTLPTDYKEVLKKKGELSGYHDILKRLKQELIQKSHLHPRIFEDLDLFSQGSLWQLRRYIKEGHISSPLILSASSDINRLYRLSTDRKSPESKVIQSFETMGVLIHSFNNSFFLNGDSLEPETAGIWGALVGSLMTIFVTLLISFPLGVGTAVYLEEFAWKNVFTRLIEINISNLAAVPSIIFGLLGLAIFLNMFGMPRSAPIAGGLTLALMIMPTIVIASRTALQSVPRSIRDAARALGASRVQTTFHHVVPLAMPGIMTGTILAIARAFGESAPLLMIGMMAFIADVPESILDSATVLPVQIFSWARNPEPQYIEITAAAVLVLLGMLATLNLIAVCIRKKFEVKV